MLKYSKMRLRVIKFFIISLLILGFGFFVDKNTSQLPDFTPNPQFVPQEDIQTDETFLVTRVIDGDTIELEDGRRVRYIGIDTPEIKDSRKSVQCFAREAMEKNKELVEGKYVRLGKDVSDKDKYGRLLRYVYIQGSEEIFVNDYLARQGFALVATYPPDVKYQEKFIEVQKEARVNNRGLWRECSY